jgi:cytoskeletal protein CcmA (bactofilin family)
MLDPKRKAYNEGGKTVTVIAQGTTIIGELRSKGTIRVEGNISGRIQCDDTITVQETGRVKADLVASQIIISGEVEGNVYAHDRLEVQANAKLIGDITAPRVGIAEGVLFEGKCTMKPPGQMKPPAAAGTAAAAEAPAEEPVKAGGGNASPKPSE